MANFCLNSEGVEVFQLCQVLSRRYHLHSPKISCSRKRGGAGVAWSALARTWGQFYRGNALWAPLGLFLLVVLGHGDWRRSDNDSSYQELARFEEELVTLNKPQCMQDAFCPIDWEPAESPAGISSPFLVTFCHLPATMWITPDLLEIIPMRKYSCTFLL